MLTARRKTCDGDSTGRHHRQRTHGIFEREERTVGYAMKDSHLRSRSCHAHLNLFLEAGERLDRSLGNQAVCGNGYFDRHVVGRPSRDGVLGSFPNTISAAKLELFFSSSSELTGKFFEKIQAAHKSKSDDSRSNVGGDDECHFAVAYLVAITPPFIFN